MILVRRRNEFAREMIRQLMERGVPVAGADRMVLMDQIAIADLVALGRFALLPEDDLTLAALLKSPLVGSVRGRAVRCSRCAARRAAVGGSDRAAETSGPSSRARTRSCADILRAGGFRAAVRILRARARRRVCGGKLVARLGEEAADAIDEFLALALAHEGAHPPSLEGFLDWFEKGASEVKRDMEQGGGAVRVMTVHGAKGLEAQHRDPAGHGADPGTGTRAGLLYTDDCVFFGVKKELDTPAGRRRRRAKRRDREMREYRRLLYVALTRAREWLIVAATRRSRRHPRRIPGTSC